MFKFYLFYTCIFFTPFWGHLILTLPSNKQVKTKLPPMFDNNQSELVLKYLLGPATDKRDEEFSLIQP